ncbi:L-threonylcarbamoyladenylate synthase [Gammaproteobacteria bacterium]|nr:L-threonylcarbamoyladenylate synthase [Gammaproteobacteria bacterium]
MKTEILNADKEGIKIAATQLRLGKLVAFPTETVYGLGANACINEAIADIYKAKRRPSFNPLIVHFNCVNDVKQHVIWNEWSEKLATTFWPGAITFILKRTKNSDLSVLVSAGLDTVAVRIPSNKIAQNLIKEAACPIAAPSANSSGKISPTNAEHVRESLSDRIPYIINGGSCTIGLESTVINLSDNIPILLRSGGIPIDKLEKIIGPVSACDNDSMILSPGMLKRHYAPDTPIRLNATKFSKTESVIGFGPDSPHSALNLSSTGDLIEAAANLFNFMHKLNKPGAKPIAVMPIPEVGLGLAINDRLRRSAANE